MSGCSRLVTARNGFDLRNSAIALQSSCGSHSLAVYRMKTLRASYRETYGRIRYPDIEVIASVRKTEGISNFMQIKTASCR